MKSKKLAGVRKVKPTAKQKAAAVVSAASDASADGGVDRRMTISLHGTDTGRLDELEDYLRTQGHRVSNKSLLFKVALRGVEMTPRLAEHLRAAQAEDGRRRKTAEA
jgi:hypothetical protein